jgi:hypothetical protein
MLLAYAKYARENFVNYRDLSADDNLAALLRRAYTHSSWVLSKVPPPRSTDGCFILAALQYSIDGEKAAARLKDIGDGRPAGQ